MEEEKGCVGSSARASSSVAPAAPPPAPPPNPPPAPPPPPPPSSSNPPKEPAAEIQRQLFSVDLKPGETTIVSWKKLLRESRKRSGEPLAPTAGDPAFESRGGPAAAVQPLEGELTDGLPNPSRFSAVIEKIERLYMGKHSSDEEELDDIPDDDQYDTEDSFIDDAELDEYFQVDKLSTKHNGYFVNRGKLERIEASSSPNLAPKKRRRKDPTDAHSEKDREPITSEPVNMGNMRIKAAARNAPLVGKKLSSSSSVQAPAGEHYQGVKALKNKLYASTETYKKRSVDFAIKLENPPSVRIPNKDVSSLPLESKDFDKHKAAGVIPHRDPSHKSRSTNETFDVMYQASRDRSVSSQVGSQSKKLVNGENEAEVYSKVRRKERYRTSEFPDMNYTGSAYPMQAVQPPSARVKEGSVMRPKGTALERAIRDLEKIVAVCRPANLDVQEVDASSQGVKRRLPQEVKHKLAKVARLSASQGKISEEDIIDRLMGIVGHLVQRKTLKRNMREMVELGLSAKQQKADRFQQIKKEVNEMIRTHVSLLNPKVPEQRDGSTDDFQEVNGNVERGSVRKAQLDNALEDKICDLYDLYVEGMDEDKGPQSRKLYVELAELWPDGSMDNYGIKDAIYRSKERKRAIYKRHKFRDEERIKRKKLAASIKIGETSLGPQVQTGQLERQVMDTTGQVLVPPDKITSNLTVASSAKTMDTISSSSEPGQFHGSKHHDKVRGGSSTSTAPDSGSKTAVADIKKKIKRKSESDSGEIHLHPPKLPSQPGKERHSSHKHSDDTNASHQPKQNPPLPGVLGSDQPS